MKTNIFTNDPLGSGMTYGERLEKALTDAGKTRKQLAAVLECTPQAIGMVITGGGKTERSLSAENSAKAARFLRVDGYWLATGYPPEIKTGGLNLSADAQDLALYFDRLTNENDRTRVYVATMGIIIAALNGRDKPSGAPSTEAPAPAANPKKQSS